MDDLLKSYFLSFERFHFTGCNDILKQKGQTISATPYAQLWGALSAPLLLLASAESMYLSFSYLDVRSGRKEAFASSRFLKKGDIPDSPGHLNSIYAQLLNDLKRVESQLQEREVTDSKTIVVLIQELCTALVVRQELASVYFALATASTFPNYEELVERVGKLQSKALTSFKHPFLVKWKAHVLVEVSILHGLFLTQINISQFQFPESMLVCSRLKQSIDSWKRGNSDLKIPPLYLWLFRFFATLMGKVSLYFHRVLAKEEEIGDVRSITAKNELDFVATVENFFMRTELMHLSIVVDSAGIVALGKRFSPTGFCFVPQEELYEPPTGLSSWPVIISLPTDVAPKEHWPNVVSIIMDNTAYFAKFREPYFLADKPLQVMYFISQVEPHMYLVILLGMDKKKHESAVRAFMENLSRQLRNEVLFSRLAKVT